MAERKYFAKKKTKRQDERSQKFLLHFPQGRRLTQCSSHPWNTIAHRLYSRKKLHRWPRRGFSEYPSPGWELAGGTHHEDRHPSNSQTLLLGPYGSSKGCHTSTQAQVCRVLTVSDFEALLGRTQDIIFAWFWGKHRGSPLPWSSSSTHWVWMLQGSPLLLGMPSASHRLPCLSVSLLWKI